MGDGRNDKREMHGTCVLDQLMAESITYQHGMLKGDGHTEKRWMVIGAMGGDARWRVVKIGSLHTYS